jgi:hexosaminidase
VEYMLLPRLCALAEALWSQKAQKDVEDFLQRLRAHYARFEAMGLHYRRPEKSSGK